MRENEFEKKVQQKMEGFNLSPSTGVWVEVERRIRKEKKRRFMIWLFFGLIGIGGGLTVLLVTHNKRSTTGITQNRTMKQAGIPQPVAEKKEKTSSTITLNKSVDSIDKKKENRTVHVNESIKNSPATPIAIPEKSQRKPFIASIKTQIPVKNDPKTLDNAGVIAKPVEKMPVQPVADLTVAAEAKPVDTVKTVPLVVVTPAQEKKDSVVTEQPVVKKEKKPQKWDWGITISGGRSSIVNGFFGNPVRGNVLSAGGPTGGPPSSPVDMSPSGIRPSFSWSVAVFGQRRLSKKLDVLAGLDYHYMSTKINTGNRVDSSRIVNNYSGVLQVNSFYRTGNTSSYTSQYHFIRLSGTLSWKIFGGKKFKLNWDNGIGYSRLLGSTMLHYNSAIYGFYKDNRLLTKDHLSVSTGFSFPVSKKWVINPYASYSLTPVMKGDHSQKTNFTDYGIRLRLLLNKK
ncbi:MAG TPA: hypothetical protein VGO58_05860 [Chitinophagaceae bacterium]|jgi:hypothetical protein|nr:hypothetical protein [Chitinophagaceae bacterium]